MVINQQNNVLFIMSMIFAINIGITKSNSDKADAAFLRSRRQLALKDDISTCTDECITSNLYAVSSRTYTPKQLRNMCLEGCQKQAKNLLENSKQSKEIKDYHHELQPVSSKNVDCEMKCLALKASGLSLANKKSFCRKQCIYA